MEHPPPVQRCPARDECGFEALPPGEVLQASSELVERIRLTFGLDPTSFDAEVRPTIEAYSRFVHLLPASASDHFVRPGGLLQLGLEVGFYALQGTDAHIFSGQSSISTRRILEPRWRHATFLAGLCCELHRPLTAMVVADPNGSEWPAWRLPLADWLAARATDHYFVRWRTQSVEARGAALFVLPHLFPPATLEYLDTGRSTIVPHLFASIAGLSDYGEHNVLDKLVRRSLELVIERDRRAASDWHGVAAAAATTQRSTVEQPPPEAPDASPPSSSNDARESSLPETGAVQPSLPFEATPSPTPISRVDSRSADRIRLQVPLRLDAAVRDTLASIVDTLEGPADLAAAHASTAGLFVPLVELERRGVQPALVIRALGDLGLLVRDGSKGTPTTARRLGDTAVAGLVLDPRCVAGLDFGQAQPPDAA